MKKKGFNRALIEIVPEGILVRPYAGEGKKQSVKLIELPESWGNV